jgi:anti-sigma28 factor (negative regulator of flagellin synthesis)
MEIGRPRLTYLKELANGHELSNAASLSVSTGLSSRLVALRMCIRRGTYSVNSNTLARCIIESETHFLQMHRE